MIASRNLETVPQEISSIESCSVCSATGCQLLFVNSSESCWRGKPTMRDRRRVLATDFLRCCKRFRGSKGESLPWTSKLADLSISCPVRLGTVLYASSKLVLHGTGRPSRPGASNICGLCPFHAAGSDLTCVRGSSGTGKFPAADTGTELVQCWLGEQVAKISDKWLHHVGPSRSYLVIKLTLDSVHSGNPNSQIPKHWEEAHIQLIGSKPLYDLIPP